MALVPTVSKAGVTKTPAETFVVTVNLSVMDDVLIEEVINKEFSQTYNPGDSVEIARDQLLSKIQQYINDYKSEQTVYNSVALDNAVSYIQTNIVM